MMCLRALGHNVTEDEVNKVMGATPTKGACWEQALATAQHYGCRATLTCPSTVTQLKSWTDQGLPVMIAWNPEGRDWSHASTVFDVTRGLPEDIPAEAIVQGSGSGLYVWVADSNIPHPEKLIRVVHEDLFYSKWYEKWPQYLVRRPALMLEREISAGGRQMMASTEKVAWEIYVDENGMVHDDEGNIEGPVRGWGQGTYHGAEATRIVRQLPQQTSYSRPSAPQRVNRKKLDVMNALLAKRPGDSFLKSLRDQVAAGRSLSEKQLKAIRQNLYRNGMKPDADHFRSAASAERVAARYALQDKLPSRDRGLINDHLARKGLDGNGRFRRAEDGYVLSLEILSEHGIELGQVVNSFLFKPDSNTLNIDLAFSNEEDPFSPRDIRNTMLYLAYTRLENDKFEVLAYLT